MDTSDEMKQANERADEIAAELDRAVTNAKAVASEDTARARQHIKQTRDNAKPPAAHPGT
jgi:hypothetical protein